MSEIKKAVADYLAQIGVLFTATYQGKNSPARPDFPGSYHWAAAFGKGAAVEAFDYFMGAAHVDEAGAPAAPCACEVLYCLVHDAEALGMTFEEWANELGCDEDSRSAARTYNACREEGEKLARVFTSVEIEAIRVLTEEY